MYLYSIHEFEPNDALAGEQIDYDKENRETPSQNSNRDVIPLLLPLPLFCVCLFKIIRSGKAKTPTI